MNIVIRTDSSIDIGAGHVMRCLALADELQYRGGEIYFVCREDHGNLISLIEEKGYSVFRLNDRQSNLASANLEKEVQQTKSALTDNIQNVDLLIVDHYALDAQWETQMRPAVKKIMVIDDMANRQHNCDVLLDQNFYENFQNRYHGIVPDNCQKLLGPDYALLRPQFREARKKLRIRNGKVQHILLFFGSSDPTNETAKALKALRLLNLSHLTTDVVVGNSNPQKELIREQCQNMQGTHYHCQVDNMAQLMVRADLAIGAGGSTTWERCCVGLPAIVTVLSESEHGIAFSVDKAGAVINMGWGHNLTPGNYLEAIKNLNARRLYEMSVKGLNLVDGEGCPRVVQKILSIIG